MSYEEYKDYTTVLSVKIVDSQSVGKIEAVWPVNYPVKNGYLVRVKNLITKEEHNATVKRIRGMKIQDIPENIIHEAYPIILKERTSELQRDR